MKTELTPAYIDEVSRRLKEPKTLTDWRHRALTAYHELPIPDRVQHLWRYSDPLHYFPNVLTAELSGSAPILPDLPAGGAAALLLPDSRFQLNLSPEAERAGVTVSRLSDNPIAGELLGRAVDHDFGLFEALNAAAFEGGIAVHVPARVQLDGPIHVRLPAYHGATLPRILVVVGENAEATVIEEYVGGGPGDHVIGVSEYFVAASARLKQIFFERWNPGVVGHLTLRARLDRQADFLSTGASFGGSLLKVDLGSILDGEGARSELSGMTMGEKRQHFDHHTVHDHRAPRTWSNIDIKTALTGRGHAAYTGLIRIGEAGVQSEAYQENRNLMLSSKAKADTIPELEILTDDVRCTHGATVAPVDDAQLFYLQSRGIERSDALRLIVRGFMEKNLARFPESLRDAVDGFVMERLNGITAGF